MVKLNWGIGASYLVLSELRELSIIIKAKDLEVIPLDPKPLLNSYILENYCIILG